MFSGKTRDSTDQSWESNKTGECVSKIERKVGSLEILRETSSTTSLERQNSIYLGSWDVSPFVTQGHQTIGISNRVVPMGFEIYL